MSRLVAGIRNKTVIITVPGSPKGAKENLEAVIKLLPHACMQAAGMDSRVLHAGGVKKLEQEAGVSSSPSQSHSHDQPHSHHHAHGGDHGHAIPKPHTIPQDRPVSNDPSAGPTSRYRESPYPMLSVEEAITTILAETPKPKIITRHVDTSLVGYTLAEDVTATEAVPAFRASIVDGYAVITGPGTPSTKGVFPVASISHASPGEIPPLKRGQIARITTGAPLPPGATSVVMVEDTAIKSMTPDGKEEREVEILTDEIQPDENVREVGSDIRAGEIILHQGEKISSAGGELGLLASVGRAEVKVWAKPVVGVLSTGDEIVPHNRPGELRLGEVRDCNRMTVMAAIKSWDLKVVDFGIARDTAGALEEALRLALRSVDTLITTGGVSMGELDLLKPTVERGLGGTIHFGRVAMKPGKPTTFASVEVKDNAGQDVRKLIFSLPGNPASAVVCTGLFVYPSLRAQAGELEGLEGEEKWKSAGLVRTKVQLLGDVRCDKTREEYQRAVLSIREDRLCAGTTGMQRSSRVGSFRRANALLVLPAGGGMKEKGSVVEALLLGNGIGT